MNLLNRFIVILLLLAVLPVARADAPYTSGSINGIASKYLFNLASHELSIVSEKLLSELSYGLKDNTTTSTDRVLYVKKYFELNREASSLKWQLEQVSAGSREEKNRLITRLKEIDMDREKMKDRVEYYIERDIEKVLIELGLSWRNAGRFIFPPVRFGLGNLPYVLIISPRYKIEIQKSLLLTNKLTDQKMEHIESGIEAQNLSALIEGIGGIATYPSSLQQGYTLDNTLSAVAHEWCHQYLAFHPLGKHYADNYQLTTINETIADIIGEEVANITLTTIYSLPPIKKEKPPEGIFSFSREMRRIRLTVDDLLSQGRIAEAERFMEEQRLFFKENGYYLRRLNQAYFAFHGSYADSPASSSPIAEKLNNLRLRYNNAGDFLKVVAVISSEGDLDRLVGTILPLS